MSNLNKSNYFQQLWANVNFDYLPNYDEPQQVEPLAQRIYRTRYEQECNESLMYARMGCTMWKYNSATINCNKSALRYEFPNSQDPQSKLIDESDDGMYDDVQYFDMPDLSDLCDAHFDEIETEEHVDLYK